MGEALPPDSAGLWAPCADGWASRAAKVGIILDFILCGMIFQGASRLTKHDLNLMRRAIVRKWNICAVGEQSAVQSY